jgi:hypothetical protein
MSRLMRGAVWQVQTRFKAHGDAIRHALLSADKSKSISRALPKKLPPLKLSVQKTNVNIVRAAAGKGCSQRPTTLGQLISCFTLGWSQAAK